MAGADVSSANALVATTVMAISASAKGFRESSVVIEILRSGSLGKTAGARRYCEVAPEVSCGPTS
jgi:hypothetical protein